MVTIATIVRNEADNFLTKALECWQAVSDRIIVCDNGSTDATPDILSECDVYDFELPMDGHETAARQFLWEKAVDATPDGDWIVHLDADHCVAGDFRDHLTGDRVLFPVFDMWTPTAYRSDAWWRVRPWWQAVRITAETRDSDWHWPQRGWHSGHVPLNAPEVFGPAKNIPDDCGILHYGYATDAFRVKHHAAYLKRAEYLTDGEQFHASTIMDARPRLVALPFQPKWTLL